MKRLLLAFLFCYASLLSSAQPGTLDASFNPVSGANEAVYSMALQPDGKILIVGKFTAYDGVPRHNIARLNANGTLDSTFDLGKLRVYSEAALAIQNDGKVLVSGDFVYNDNIELSNRVVRLNADGTLDASFNTGGSGADSEANSIVIQNDGKIIIAGGFYYYNGVRRYGIARLHADGTLDTSFDPGLAANDYIVKAALQSDGKILIAGEFTAYNGKGRNGIARLNEDGSLDETFDPGTGATGGYFSGADVRDVTLQSDGKILICGFFTAYNNVPRKYIARLNPDGSLDTSFDPGSGADDVIRRVTVQTNGKILISGFFNSINGATRNHLARLNADGSLDAGFNHITGPSWDVNTIVNESANKILIGGIFNTYDGVSRNRVARLYAGDAVALTTGNVGLSSYCAGSTIDIPYTITGTFAVGNVYTAQLSDAAGRFITPVAIGTTTANTSGTITATIPATIEAGTDYRVRVVSSSHIKGNDNGTNIAIKTMPSVVADGVSAVCEGSLLHLYVTTVDQADYSWTGPNSFSASSRELFIPDMAIANAGTYTATVTKNGCSASSSIVVTLNPAPAATVGNSRTICAGTSITLGTSSVPGHTYWWTSNQSGFFFFDGNPTVTPTATTTYTLRETIIATGCQKTSSVTITVNSALATPTITAAASTTICEGSSVVLTSSAATGNQWYKDGVLINGATAQAYTATQGGSYTVIVSVNDCASPASTATVVTVTPLPAKSVITQAGNTLTSSAATGNQWYLNGVAITGATSQQYQVQAAGAYAVRTTQNNCSILSDPHNFLSTAIVSPATWNGEVYAYPNPVIKNLYIKNNGNRKLDMQLVDALGKVVYRAKVTTAIATLDMAGQARGIYRLLVTDVNKQQTISINVIKQ